MLAKYWKDVLRSLVSIGRTWSVYLSGWQVGERGEKIGTASGQVCFGRLLRKSRRLLKFWDFFKESNPHLSYSNKLFLFIEKMLESMYTIFEILNRYLKDTKVASTCITID